MKSIPQITTTIYPYTQSVSRIQSKYIIKTMEIRTKNRDEDRQIVKQTINLFLSSLSIIEQLSEART